ncbi:MAG TPA: VTT domain-containing protein [Deltaproteobacteria bacterium]|nr:VTT domain-containing protein [Deltaproteobacteria bacterium]HOI05929.1 VTT domain-containing protein [Deltaproteobacteria bacterium]
MDTKEAPKAHGNAPLRPALARQLEDVIERCTDCGVCRDECGFLQKHGTPVEIAQGFTPKQVSRQALPFECSLCRLCDAVCPAGLKPRDLFMEMRREAVERGQGPFPEHKGELRYEKTGMSRTFTWYALPDGCTSVLFPGCSFAGTRPGRTRELYATLSEKNPSLGVVLDCCGRISSDLGREAFARIMMEEMADYLLSQGVREVITVCPNCRDMFMDYGKGLSVVTVYEMLAAGTPAPAPGGKPLVLHDPCGARFHRGSHDSVRLLLRSAGFSAEEMGHSRERTMCCGNGAGVDAFSPELSRKWLKKTSGEAGGRPVVTYCAGCAGALGSCTQAAHVLDAVYEPQNVTAGRTTVSKGIVTFLSRLRLKRHFQSTIAARSSRERRFVPEGEGGKSRAGRLLILAAVIAAIVAVRMTGAADALDRDHLQAFVEGCGSWAPLIYMLVYAIAPSLFLPGLPITIVGGMLFGPFWGVVYTITGATAGACLAFLIARYAARDWVEGKLTSPRWKKLDEGVERNGWKVVAFTRLIPLFPFNLLNYAFGLTKIGFVPYAVTSFICMLPACIAFIVFSSSLLDLLRGRVSLNLIIGAGLIALVSLIPIVYNRKRKGEM